MAAFCAELTARGREIMALAAEGHFNHDIAARLVLSPTVRTHIQRTMTKLHVRDRAQFVVIAYQTRLVTPPPLDRRTRTEAGTERQDKPS